MMAVMLKIVSLIDDDLKRVYDRMRSRIDCII